MERKTTVWERLPNPSEEKSYPNPSDTMAQVVEPVSGLVTAHFGDQIGVREMTDPDDDAVTRGEACFDMHETFERNRWPPAPRAVAAQ